MEFVVFQFFINYKRTVTLIAFSVLVIYAPVAQSRHDFTWVLGFSQDGTSLKPGGTIVDFNYSPPKTSYLQLPALSISSYCSMSDAHGRLLFYTNGCDLFNADHEVMQNGHGMNFGKKYSEYCVELALGYPSQHGWITLPMIGDTEKYIIVSLSSF